MKKFTKVLALLLMVAMVVSGCSKTIDSSNDTPANETSVTYNDGTYTATGSGNNGDVVVEVVISNGKIEAVNVVEHGETPGLGDTAMETVAKAIVEANSAEVDVVAGATNSSTAVMDAVQECLNQAAAN